MFIHSNKKYTERSMYLIDPYRIKPPVSLGFEAFVAPSDFNPDAQELNIVKAFADFPDVDKKYIFLVRNNTKTVLPAVTGRSYAYSENSGPYATISSGEIIWTSGSTKRHVIGIDANNIITANVDGDSVLWIYISKKCNSIQCNSNCYYLKFVHCESLNSLTSFGTSALEYCNNVQGILNIPNTVTSIGISAFRLCSATKIVISDNVTKLPYQSFGASSCNEVTFNATTISDYAFAGCSNISLIKSKRVSPPTLSSMSLTGMNKTTCVVHVPIGSLDAYRSNTYWNEFTNIIADL